MQVYQGAKSHLVSTYRDYCAPLQKAFSLKKFRHHCTVEYDLRLIIQSFLLYFATPMMSTKGEGRVEFSTTNANPFSHNT